MHTLRKVIIRCILVIFVLSTIGVVILYLFNPNPTVTVPLDSLSGDTQILSGDTNTTPSTGS